MIGMDTLTLSVPPHVLATYVVAVPARIPDLADIAAAAAREIEVPAFDPPANMLERRGMTVTETNPGDHGPVPLELLGALGASPTQLAAVRAARRLIIVSAAQATGWANYGDWAALGVAAGVAKHVRGVLIDPVHPKVLDPEAAVATIPRTVDDFVLSQWVSVSQSMDDGDCWFTTSGMCRFGLPELEAIDVPPSLASRWTGVLTGIANRLIDLWCDALRDDRDASFLELPAEFHITGGDVESAYGRPAQPGPDVRVRLELDPAPDPGYTSFLTVVPPHDYPRSAGEFFAEVCDIVRGPAPSPTRHVHPSPERDEAIAAARSELASVRDRFLDGPLDRAHFSPSSIVSSATPAHCRRRREPPMIAANSSGPPSRPGHVQTCCTASASTMPSSIRRSARAGRCGCQPTPSSTGRSSTS